MKKLISVLLAVMMVLSLAACGEEKAQETPEPQPTETEQTQDTAEITPYSDTIYLDITATSPGGTAYTMGAAMAKVLEDHLNVSWTLMPGSTSDGFKGVSKGDNDLCFTHNIMTSLAENAQSPFDSVYTGVKAILPATPAAIQIFTRADSKITDLSELGNKNIDVGSQGSTGAMFMLSFLEAEYGFTPDTISANGGSVSYLSNSEAVAAIQDGQVDVSVQLGVYPKPNVQELENTPGIHFLSLDQSKLDDFLSKYPYWTQFSIPANTYAGQTEDVLSVTAYLIISCAEDMDEDLVYNMVKTIWENKGEVDAAAVESKEWMRLSDIPAIAATAGLHPGAERYYKEVGAL